jgi:hypothetical protein
MWLTNVIFEDKVIEDERLELRGKDDLYFLGPNFTLRSCTLVLQVPARQIHLCGVKLIDCVLEVKRELKNLPWYEANLKGCRITGRFSGCDFGYNDESARLYHDAGGIEDCDFTGAHLHACRFIGCDPSTLRFPPWPCFTILDSYRRSRELAARSWPEDIQLWFTTFDKDPEKTVACTYSATTLAKETGISEKRIRSLLEGIPDVIW